MYSSLHVWTAKAAGQKLILLCTEAEFEALSESFESLNLQSVVIDSATYVHTHTISSASASYVRMYILQINSLVI